MIGTKSSPRLPTSAGSSVVRENFSEEILPVSPSHPKPVAYLEVVATLRIIWQIEYSVDYVDLQ
jgi:hypothetical protein